LTAILPPSLAALWPLVPQALWPPLPKVQGNIYLLLTPQLIIQEEEEFISGIELPKE
jgi:hypothetical protein